MKPAPVFTPKRFVAIVREVSPGVYVAEGEAMMRLVCEQRIGLSDDGELRFRETTTKGDA